MDLDILYGSWDIWAEEFRDFFAICTIQQRCFSAFLKMRKVELLNEIKYYFSFISKIVKIQTRLHKVFTESCKWSNICNYVSKHQPSNFPCLLKSFLRFSMLGITLRKIVREVVNGESARCGRQPKFKGWH